MTPPASSSSRKIRVAWLAPYAVQDLASGIQLSRRPSAYHACSWIVNLSRALARRPDVDLHLITESVYVAQNQTVRHDGITFHVVRQGVPVIHRGFPVWCPLDVLTGFRSSVAALTRTLRAIEPDLVHGHGTEAAYGKAALASGRPCLISIQGIITEYYKTNPDFRFRIVRHFEQDQVRRGKYFTCRTSFDTGFVSAVNPAARIFQIHEAMNPVFFEGEWRVQDEPHVLFVGGLQERKGIRTLILALAEVKRAIPAVKLSVIGGGGGEFAQSLHALVAELGLGANVQFLGQKNADEIGAWHRRAQLFVLPSDNENSPNALAEAMVSGMPVIASNVGGIPSMVEPGQTGLLVEVRNPVALAEAMTRLLQDPAQRARLGANARAVARERHLPESVADATVKAYREILAKENPSPTG